MNAKEFLKQKGISDRDFMETGITDLIEQLLTEYSQSIQLTQTAVSSQRELLFAYEKMRTNQIIGATDDWRYANVDLFLSK